MKYYADGTHYSLVPSLEAGKWFGVGSLAMGRSFDGRKHPRVRLCSIVCEIIAALRYDKILAFSSVENGPY